MKPQNSEEWLEILLTVPKDWQLLPLNGQKVPFDYQTGQRMSDWGNKQFSIDEIAKIVPEAVGVKTGPCSGGLGTFDFDGPGSDEKFLEIFGQPPSALPESIAWTSGSFCRFQYSFQVPQQYWHLVRSKKWFGESKKHPVLEFRWAGMQSAFAGAHPKTQGYGWVDGASPLEIPSPTLLPDWILDVLIEKPHQVSSRSSSKVDDVDKALECLSALPASDFEAYSNWLKVGMALHHVSPSLLENWIGWCRIMSNFNEEECRAKWTSFGTSSTPVTLGTLIHLATNYKSMPIQYATDSNRNGCSKILSAHQVCADVGKFDWRINGFAEKGIVLLAAETGTGKTSFLYRAADAIQEGDMFLGEVATKQGNVLVVQGDEPSTQAGLKFRRMGLKQNFHIVFDRQYMNLDSIFSLIKEGYYSVLIIDSLTTVLVSRDCTTLDSAMTNNLYKLNELATNHGVTILMTAHLNKPPKDGNGIRRHRQHLEWADISGLNSINGAVNDGWGLTKVGEFYSLHCLGKRSVKVGTEWILQGTEEDFGWYLKEVTNGLRPLEEADVTKRIVAFLATVNRPMTPKEVSLALSTNEEYSRRCLVDLFLSEKLKRDPISTGNPGRPSYGYALI